MEEMRVPPVSIDREFVETWARRYRCGSANSRWRAGPKLTAAISAHPEMQVLFEIATHWDLEEYIFETIGSAIRREGSFTLPDFLTVGYWKTPRQLGNYRKNARDNGKVQRVTLKALSDDLPNSDRPGVLSELTGVRVPVASALLTVWHPDEFTIIDIWSLKTLSLCGESIDGIRFEEHGQPWWEDHYEMYLRACLAIADRVTPLSLRDIDRALWKWGQLNTPR
jgi:hypothetical protein